MKRKTLEQRAIDARRKCYWLSTATEKEAFEAGWLYGYRAARRRKEKGNE